MREERTHTSLRAALAGMASAAEENASRSLLVRDRAVQMLARLDAGEAVYPIVAEEASPRTVELLTQNLAVLETAGSALRTALARALRDEGLTIEQVAALFGVTRQRISALLRQGA